MVLTLALLLPTALWVHLRLPEPGPCVEFLTVLPYVVPPIALVAGVAAFFRPQRPLVPRQRLLLVPFYMVLALPFTFRALDAGIRAIDVRTLVDASRSLGAGWGRHAARVLIPNLAAAIVSSAFLTATVVLGEFTIAAMLLKRTFPTFLFELPGAVSRKAAWRLALLTLVATTALLGLLTRRHPAAGRARPDHRSASASHGRR